MNRERMDGLREAIWADIEESIWEACEERRLDWEMGEAAEDDAAALYATLAAILDPPPE